MPTFPSIYRARATAVGSSKLTVLVPQVFGEQTIEVTDFLGPPARGMGWVFFQGGNPEFPVWTTEVASPGQIPEIPEYTEEFAEIDHRLDLVEATVALPPTTVAGNALGVVSIGVTNNSPLALLVNPGIAISNVLTFTGLIGRRYSLKYSTRALQATATAGVGSTGFVTMYKDGARIPLSDSWFNADVNYGGRDFEWYFEGDGLSHTYQMWGVLQSGTITMHNQMDAGNAYYYIEDIGPTISPPLPISPTPAPWVNLSFDSGWRGYQGGTSVYNTVKYRRIGDVVTMRGLAEADSGSGTITTTIGTLPVGFRPAIQEIFNPCTSIGAGNIRVDARQDGKFVVSAAVPVTGSWISFADISFSVTP